jgi:catechol 2,3-dioxygenase-like lactoylglutathione lyase family enzyme
METYPLSSVILFVRDIPATARFYQAHFGYLPGSTDEPGWLELRSPDGGANIALHQAAKSQKRGSEIKLAFRVKDVAAFRTRALRQGLKFGVIHEVRGFQFSNAKDPAGNAICISSRAFLKQGTGATPVPA